MAIDVTKISWADSEGRPSTLERIQESKEYTELPGFSPKPKKEAAPPMPSAREAFEAQQRRVIQPPLPPPGFKPPPEPEPEPEPPPVNHHPRYVTEPQEQDTRYTRVSVPSNCVFYDFDDIQVRPFEVDDLAKLSRAQLESKTTILIDVIDGVVNQDVRDLTIGDFYYLLYLIRIWSYPKTPLNLTWTSKYGNRNQYEVTRSNIVVDECHMDRDVWYSWQERGFCVPTVRDLEVFQNENLAPEFQWKYQRAQYLQGTSVEDKVAKLTEFRTLGILEDIREFTALINHGVVETVEVRDAFFDPRAWLARLQEMLADTKDRSLEFEIRRQIRELEARLRKGELVVPDVETIRISINLLAFFPDL